MKKMKRLVALALSVVMVLAMSVVAFADDNTYTITAPDNGHTYEVYQIFTAKLSKETENGETKTILSDVKWGKNGKGGTVGEAVSSTILDEIKGTTGNDTKKLEVISKYVDLTSQKYGKVKANEPLTGVPAGYYLIKDVDDSQTNKDDSYTKYIVQVVESLTITPKAEKPKVEKKVKENEKYQQDGNEYGTGYNDTADYNIGDMVPFELIGTIPDMSQYKTYKYTFYDELSEAFDNVDVSNIKVYRSNTKAIDEYSDEITNYFNQEDEKGTITSRNNKINVSVKDLKDIAGSYKYIIVQYSAKLNSSAAIGQNKIEGKDYGNINKVYLKYSNNPNQGGEGEEGKTPEDVVIVFTYKLVTNKKDGKDGTPLNDVTFNLYRKNGNTTEYAVLDNNKKLVSWTTDEINATTLRSEKGKFEVTGLDAGTYYIHEIQALSGYNKMEDVEVVITANTNNGQKGEGKVTELGTLEVTADGKNGTGDASKGEAEITVVNNKGSQLPSTGGIGTTIFYVVGGILMAGAAVLLITKRRAEN